MSKSNLISVKNLHQRIDTPGLIILDTSIHVIDTDESKLLFCCIPTAKKFDLKNRACDKANNLPNTMPNSKEFETYARELGINKESTIVIYDSQGIYSSARVWWMFKLMGHKEVYVLNGGLPHWLEKGFNTSSEYSTTKTQGNFQAKQNGNKLVTAETVLNSIDDQNKLIIDARSHGRFIGVEREPRAGLRKGHIPYSVNIPFPSVLNNGLLKTVDELKNIFNKVGATNNQSMIFSCGSGLTACITLLAAYECDYKRLSLYDGSWSEWGAENDFPVSK